MAREAPTSAGDSSGCGQLPPSDGSLDAWFTPLRFGLILAAFIVAWFPGVLLGSESFFYRDYGVLGFPFIYYHHESFWRGELPLWNPLSNCGAPFLAQWGTLALYPLSLIHLVFPLPWSLGVFCLGHLFLGGLGMYFLAQRWVDNRFAASVAGLAFAFNGVALSSLMWPNYTVALGWMPWMILLVEQGWREGRRRILLAALVAALQMLSGVPEFILLTWLLLLLMLAGQLITNRVPRTRACGRFLLMILLVAGLTAVQLLPFFDLLAHSQRSPGFAAEKWAMPGWGWANLLVPMFHYFQTPQGVFFQDGQQFLTSYYLGTGVLLLGLLAVWHVRQRRVYFLAAITLLGLILALGENGPLLHWLKHTVPALGLIRYPVKYVVLAVIALPLLAAYGMRWTQTLPATLRARAWRAPLGWWLALLTLSAGILWFGRANPFYYDHPELTEGNAAGRVGFLTALLALIYYGTRGLRPRQLLLSRLGILILLGLDGLTHLPRLNPVISANAFAPRLAQQELKLRPPPALGTGRVMISPAADKLLLNKSLKEFEPDFLGKRLGLWSNLNLLEGFPKVNGSSTLQLKEQAEIQSLLYASPTTDLPRVADFLAVSHVTKPGTLIEWTARTTQMPMITSGQQPVFADTNATLRALLDPGFDPRHVVYLPPEAKPFISVTNSGAVKISSHDFRANKIEVMAEAEQPALLVVAQSFYHPWRAYVDGQAVPLWRANHAFQALQIPMGSHRVTLVYEDRQFQLGALISGITLVGCVLLWFRKPTP